MEYLAFQKTTVSRQQPATRTSCPPKEKEDDEDLTLTWFAYSQSVLEIKRQTDLPVLSNSHDVLIQVAYSDVNPQDLTRLHPPLPPQPQPQHVDVPRDPNGDNNDDSSSSSFLEGWIAHGGTGTVLAVGDMVPRHWVHQAVCFVASCQEEEEETKKDQVPWYATHVVVHARGVALLPQPSLSLSLPSLLRQAASVPLAGLAAYRALAKVGLAPTHHHNSNDSNESSTKTITTSKTTTKIRGTSMAVHDEDTTTPKSLLVVGGSGGVGSWILTLTQAWHGDANVKITATASTREHQGWCRDTLGAHATCAHHAADIAVATTTGPAAGVDAIILCGTVPPSETLWNVLCNVVRDHGTICFVTPPPSNLDLRPCWNKSVTVTTVNVWPSSTAQANDSRQPAQELQEILELLASQRIQAPLSPWLQGNDKERYIQENFKTILQQKSVLHFLSQRNNCNQRDYHYCGKLVLCMNNAGMNVVILVDVKTASLVTVNRHDCIQQSILATLSTNINRNNKNNTNSNERRSTTPHDNVLWKDAAKGSEREKLVKLLKEHPRLGMLTAQERKQVVEDIGLQEAENVKNLWGVSLKKRQRNKQGEEVIFVDPLTETLVELARDEIISRKLMTVGQDTNQQEIIQENVTDPDEREELIEKIRKVLRLVGE